MSICKFCGREINEGEEFCSFCTASALPDEPEQDDSDAYITVPGSGFYVSQNAVYEADRSRHGSVPQTEPVQRSSVPQTEPVRNGSAGYVQPGQQNYSRYTQAPVKPDYRQNQSNVSAQTPSEPDGKNKNIANVIFSVISFICSVFGIAISVTGLNNPYWGYVVMYKDQLGNIVRYESVQGPSINTVTTLSTAGICLFVLLLVVSVAGIIINLRKSKKQNSASAGKQS